MSSRVFKTHIGALGQQLEKDFSGSGNFFYWLVAIGVLGASGYIPAFTKFSRLFMGLIILVMFLSNRGFFAQFQTSLSQGASESVNPIGAPISATGSAGGIAGTGLTPGGIGSLVTTGVKLLGSIF